MIYLLIAIMIFSIGYLINRHVGLLNIVNPITPLYYYHTIFFFIALLYKNLYSSIEISSKAILFIIYGYCIFFITYIVGTKILRIQNRQQMMAKYAFPSFARSKYLYAAFALQSFVILALILFYIKTGSIPLLHADAEDFRIEARKGFGTIIVLSRCISDIFISVYILHVKNIWNEKKLGVVFAVYLLITFLLFLGLGSRSPIFDFVLILVVLYYWVNKKNFCPRLIALVPLLFIMMGVIGAFRQGNEVDSLRIFGKAIWRPFTNLQNFQWVLDSFPSNKPFLSGKGYLIEIATLLPGHQPNFGTWFKEEFGHEFSGGSVTVTYLGEIYANHGTIGIIFLPIVYSLFCLALTWSFSNRGTFHSTLILLMFSLSLKGMINVGLVTTLISSVMPMCVALIFYYFFAQMVIPRDRR